MVGKKSGGKNKVNKEIKKMKVNKDMTFFELMQKDPKMGEILANKGLFCGGCPMAQFETIECGARAHGIDPDKLIKELNKERAKE